MGYDVSGSKLERIRQRGTLDESKLAAWLQAGGATGPLADPAFPAELLGLIRSITTINPGDLDDLKSFEHDGSSGGGGGSVSRSNPWEDHGIVALVVIWLIGLALIRRLLKRSSLSKAVTP